MADTCHGCGNDYERIAQHWALSDCNQKRFDEYQHEVLTGLLMGDGGMSWSDDRNAPQMHIEVAEKDYVKYLSSDVFPTLSGDVYDGMTAEGHAYSQREHGNQNAKAEDYSDTFRLCIMTHSGLTRYIDWYDDSGKRFPEGLKLTPTTLKHWYCCDGHLQQGVEVEMPCANECENRDKIVSMFEWAGFEDFSWDRYESLGDRKDAARIRLRKDGVKWFFRYIGDPLPGFEYKWPEHKR